MPNKNLFGEIEEERLPPFKWHQKLYFRKGAPSLLSGIDIWYDFNWEAVVGHDRSTFPNGLKLAELVVADCPEGKKPAIVLTRGESTEVRRFETSDDYCVVINIDDYLDNVKSDVARTYFALRMKGLTGISGINAAAISDWANRDPQNIEFLEQIVGTRVSMDALDRLFRWSAEKENADALLSVLSRIESSTLRQLNTLVGLAQLKDVLQFWRENKGNSDEELWQTMLQQNVLLLSQVFAFPVVLIKSKAYVGGKGIENTGGNVVDFLMQNPLTSNIALVEIKTPTAKLTGSTYRNGICSIGKDVVGGVMQLCEYKASLLYNIQQLGSESDTRFSAFDPKCLLIVGMVSGCEDASDESKTRERRKSFELFRNQLNGVQVVTFDELFDKVELLINVLEGTVS